jgi:hypothetical protein
LLLFVVPVVAVVTEWVVAAEAEPVVVEGGGMMAFVAHTELLAVEDRSWRTPMDHREHAVVGVAAAVVAVCVGLVDNLDPILFHLVQCNFLIVFGHMLELQQRFCPLPLWQRWQRQLKIAPCLAVDALAR